MSLKSSVAQSSGILLIYIFILVWRGRGYGEGGQQEYYPVSFSVLFWGRRAWVTQAVWATRVCSHVHGLGYLPSLLSVCLLRSGLAPCGNVSQLEPTPCHHNPVTPHNCGGGALGTKGTASSLTRAQRSWKRWKQPPWCVCKEVLGGKILFKKKKEKPWKQRELWYIIYCNTMHGWRHVEWVVFD